MTSSYNDKHYIAMNNSSMKEHFARRDDDIIEDCSVLMCCSSNSKEAETVLELKHIIDNDNSLGEDKQTCCCSIKGQQPHCIAGNKRPMTNDGLLNVGRCKRKKRVAFDDDAISDHHHVRLQQTRTQFKQRNTKLSSTTRTTSCSLSDGQKQIHSSSEKMMIENGTCFKLKSYHRIFYEEEKSILQCQQQKESILLHQNDQEISILLLLNNINQTFDILAKVSLQPLQQQEEFNNNNINDNNNISKKYDIELYQIKKEYYCSLIQTTISLLLTFITSSSSKSDSCNNSKIYGYDRIQIIRFILDRLRCVMDQYMESYTVQLFVLQLIHEILMTTRNSDNNTDDDVSIIQKQNMHLLDDFMLVQKGYKVIYVTMSKYTESIQIHAIALDLLRRSFIGIPNKQNKKNSINKHYEETSSSCKNDRIIQMDHNNDVNNNIKSSNTESSSSLSSSSCLYERSNAIHWLMDDNKFLEITIQTLILTLTNHKYNHLIQSIGWTIIAWLSEQSITCRYMMLHYNNYVFNDNNNKQHEIEEEVEINNNDDDDDDDDDTLVLYVDDDDNSNAYSSKKQRSNYDVNVFDWIVSIMELHIDDLGIQCNITATLCWLAHAEKNNSNNNTNKMNDNIQQQQESYVVDKERHIPILVSLMKTFMESSPSVFGNIVCLLCCTSSTFNFDNNCEGNMCLPIMILSTLIDGMIYYLELSPNVQESCFCWIRLLLQYRQQYRQKLMIQIQQQQEEGHQQRDATRNDEKVLTHHTIIDIIMEKLLVDCIPIILKSMLNHSNSPHLQCQGCDLLVALMEYNDYDTNTLLHTINRTTTTTTLNNEVEDVRTMEENHNNILDNMSAASSINNTSILPISANTNVRRRLLESSAIDIIITALKNHGRTNIKIQIFSAMYLASVQNSLVESATNNNNISNENNNIDEQQQQNLNRAANDNNHHQVLAAATATTNGEDVITAFGGGIRAMVALWKGFGINDRITMTIENL